MAKKIVCDICGGECKDSGRYELVYKCLLRTHKDDVCFDCVQSIKEAIKKAKEKQNELRSK